MTIKQYDHCRLCGSKDISTVLDIGETALANSYLTKNQLKGPEFKAPLEVFLCGGCGSVQLKHTVSADLLFKNYLYSSSTSGNLKEYFADYAKSVTQKASLTDKSFVVAIASNDGVELRAFKNLGCKVLGVDPAENLVKIANEEGLESICDFFTEVTANKIVEKYGLADLVVCNNCFAHCDDLHEIIRGIKKVLRPNGYFVFENAYLLNTIENLDIGQIYHDHIFFHSIKPLVNLFRTHGLTIESVEKTPQQCGSIRVYVKHCLPPDEPALEVGKFISEEESAGLYRVSTYYHFYDKVLMLKAQLLDFLLNAKNKNQHVWIYGCPAKLATMAKVMGITDQLVDKIVDDSSFKQGLFAPETKIPIVPPKELKINRPDYCVIMAYNFVDLIVKKNADYLLGGGRFVVPLPEFKVISNPV